MNRNRRLLLAALAAAALLAASAVTWRALAAPPRGGPALAQVRPDGPPREAAPVPDAPVPGGPGFSMQSPALFTALSSDTTWAYMYDMELCNFGAGTGEYGASLSLPNGATVTGLVAYYYDSVSANLEVRLYRCNGIGGKDQMASASSSGTPGYGYSQDESVAHAVVDQQQYSYMAYLSIPGDIGTELCLTNVRIDYQYPLNLPLVTKGN